MAEKNSLQDDDTSYDQSKKIGGAAAPSKGILKSSQNADHLPQSQAMDSSFLAPGDIQLPNKILSRSDLLDGSNTTSRINTLTLQEKVNRRVSFAPDVTLHSFDFVPETKTASREPRRRANDVLVTSTQNENIEEQAEDHSVSMDLTSPVTVSKEAYKPVFDQEVSMEITQLFPKHTEAQKSDVEETMELTAPQSHSNNPIQEQSTMELTEVQSYKLPGKFSPPQTPRGSKRRKFNEASRDASESESSEDMELTLMEKLSPIKLGSMKQNIVEPEDRQSYSLQEFLESTGLSFFIDTDLLEKATKPIVFESVQIEQPASIRLSKILYALYLETPVLEMNAFISKELLHRIEQSKGLFDDLDRQINGTSPPPLLLSEYFNASSDMKQSMIQQLQLVKSYSKLQAKKLWLEWRIQHLSGIKTVLEENLALIREENVKVEQELAKARDIRSRAMALREAIRKEITLLRELPPEAYQEEKRLNEKVRLEQLKQELAIHAINLGNYQSLKEKGAELRRQISEKSAQSLAIKNEIKSINQSRFMESKTSNFTEYDLKKYSAKLNMLGKISGVEFVRLKHVDLTLRFTLLNSLQDLTVNLSKLTESDMKAYEIIGSTEMAFIFDYCYNKNRSAVSVQPPGRRLSVFLTSARQSQVLIKQYAMLRLLFPVDVRLKNDVRVLEINDFDLRTNSKRVYRIDLTDFLTAASEDSGEIRVRTTLISKDHFAPAPNPAAFLKKVTKVLPWFNESRVLFLDTGNG